ncbi:MBOAT family O-acyltransferase [Clostridium cylindrosporum]|uniref:Putative alginate O-acetylase AlgI n=1 Tax=Clostridium cylindrosporum DSM 605 TaxID=1121307 RepID=A0A0J8DF23_CLOCY|nr:MBOAT family O-acyltransferase [Clostridium cylindrosporum]KMT22864.1 putative alginate O-acetylase AlgI [Clostridium cylindrosporum DSM 605]
MVFSSLVFLFIFLPLIVLMYYISPKRYRNLTLLVGSLIFYGYGGVRFLIVVLLSIILNYCFGVLVHEYRLYKIKKRLVLILAVVVNLVILAYFKYFNFFVDNYNALFGESYVFSKVIMPIGISFFTFQALSYVIDVYNGDKFQRKITDLALYIVLFPQLIAGPIVRYRDVASQINKRDENINDFGEGVERFILGLGKKVLIANILGEVANDTFEAESISVMLSWVGIIAYTFQIYYDFSGYSDMAIGLGKMFGFTFLENFSYPYISKSITEFWRRWHISLGTWFRDYVYIPLGGSRHGAFRTGINLFIVWLFTGFWHGASWTFVIWGLYFGFIIGIEKAFLMKVLNVMPNMLRIMYTMVIVIIGWVLFRSEDLDSMMNYLMDMFGASSNSLYNARDFFYIANYRYEFILGFLFMTPLVRNTIIKLENSSIKAVSAFFSIVFTPLVLIVILYMVVMTLTNTGFNPFIYFRF